MTSRCKVWFALGVAFFALLGSFFRAEAATTHSVNVEGAQFIPAALPNLFVGDSVLFKIQKDWHLLYYNGTLLGGDALFPGQEVTVTFNSDGVFTVNDTRFGTSITITVTQPVNAAPTVNIANLALRVARPAGSNLVIQATADDEDGSIRRVIFHYGLGTNTTTVTNIIGTSTVSPYSITWSNPVAGKYLLRAQAYDNLEVFANSPRIALSLYTPFTNSLPGLTNISGVTNLVFQFNSDTGLVYVTEVSGNLTNWTPFITNTATNSLIEVLDTNVTTLSNRFFRIRLVP